MWQCGLNPRKSPKVWTAMTAPGMGSRGHLAARCPHRLPEKDLQGFPDATAQIGKKLPIVEEVTAEDFGDAEYEMPVRNLFEDIHAEPLPEFHHALLMA